VRYGIGEKTKEAAAVGDRQLFPGSTRKAGLV
jgi:hypothetical protein